MFNNVLQSQVDVEKGERRAEPDEKMESMEAGYGALFQPEGEDGMNKFFQIKEEIAQAGVSETSRQIKYDLHDQETKQIQQGMQVMLEDFTMDAEVRANFIGAVGDIHQRPETTMQTKLMRELTIADDDSTESDEYDDMRMRFTNTIDNVTEYNAAVQATIDQQKFEENQSGITMVADLAQMIVPFVEESNVAEALNKVKDGKISFKSFLLMGNAKKEFFNAFQSMPLDQRLASIEQFVKVAKEANTTAFMTNQLLEQQMIEELLYGGRYSTADQWVDNFVSLVDLTVLGKPLAWAAKWAKSASTLRTAKDTVRSTVSPVSPINTAAPVNVQKTKAMFQASMVDETEDAAQAFSGSTKGELSGDAILAEMAKEGGGVRNKVHRIYSEVDTSLINDVEIRNDLALSNVGSATIKEMESAAANVQDRLTKAAMNTSSRDAMFQHQVTPTGARITGVYGPDVGGFSSLEDAIKVTEQTFRQAGLSFEDMRILSKDSVTGEYVRVDSVADDAGDFLIGIDFDYRLNFSDIGLWDRLTASKNFLDRSPALAKIRANRNLFDPASILDPHLTLGANAVVDKAAKITKDFTRVGNKFVDGYRKLDAESQENLYKYILRANEEQLPHNINTLRGEFNFTTPEIKILDDFREYWDTVWQTKNTVEVRAMRNRGFMTYENAKNQDKLFMRPIEKVQTNLNEKFYDPLTDTTKSMTSKELEALYEKGGGVGKMRRVTEFGDEVTNQVLLESRNDLRVMRESDTPYPYREGYFQRTYTQPHFIIKRGRTAAGKEYEQAIATSASRIDAQVYVDRMKKVDAEDNGKFLKDTGTDKYYFRGDLKDPRAQADYEMDTFESNGLSTMRSRGEKLLDVSKDSNKQNASVRDPIDSIISSSRAMGRNVAEREFIEAAKQRFLATFSEALPKVHGKPVYPKNMDELTARGHIDPKQLADARSTYEYISYLEFGYINGMDAVFKSAFKGIAEIAAEHGQRGIELAAERISKVNPVSAIKGLSFNMYIALNPLRQFALNAHQSTLLTAAFPKYVLSQRLAKDMLAMGFKRMGHDIPKAVVKSTGRSRAELDAMWLQYERSGLMANIDQSNMVRGGLMDFAQDASMRGDSAKNLSTLPARGLRAVRKAGFDLGEEVQLMSSWLGHYDDTLKAKKGGALDATDFHNIQGKARNFTFNMNRAGDMAYNSSSLALIFQYFQVPHKALLTSMSNRAIPGAVRARLAAYEVLGFSLPPAAMIGLFGEILPDQQKHPEAYDAILSGLQFHMFNKILEGLSGEDARVDFSTLAPLDAYGMFETLEKLFSTELIEILGATPSGQLVFGNNPRLTNLAKSVSSLFYPDEMQPEKASGIAHEIGLLSSGYSNAYKAWQVLRYHKSYGARGQVTDAKVSTPEAIAQLFGFKTLDAALTMAVSMEQWKSSSKFTDDVNQWYRDYTRKLAQSGITADEEQYAIDTMATAFEVFKHNEKAMSIIVKNITRDAISGSSAMYDSVLRSSDYVTVEEMKAMAEALPDDEYQGKQKLLETIEFMKNFKYEEDFK